MTNKLYTFPNCTKCIEVKNILEEKDIPYQEINTGIGSGRREFQEFYNSNKKSIEREEGQIILPILSLDSKKIVQGLEKIIDSLSFIKMKIAGLQKESYIDYPGKISSVVFTPGCNYNCPTCHAKEIVQGYKKIKEEEIFKYLDSTKEWIEGVVLCGGEPTLQQEIIPFIKDLKKRGLEVKLDTNGSSPFVLKELKKENLVDYVAMDVKAPPQLYSQVTGKKNVDVEHVKESIKITSKFPDYEFRTTIVPLSRKEKEISFMSVKEVGNIAKFIYETTGNKESKYFLQKFIARNKREMIDEKFSKENLPKSMHETPDKLLVQILEKVKKYLPNSKMR